LDPEDIQKLTRQVRDEELDAAAALGHRLLSEHARMLEDKSAKAAIRRLLIALTQSEHVRARELYLAAGTTQGEVGPDLLYQMIESGGRTPWATDAHRTLTDETVREKASVALKIAFDLRTAPCNEKIPLVDRAAEEGDGRALIALEIQARGCFKDTRKVDAALEKLRKRLEAQEKSGGNP
jgi:hypothetical protein